MAIGGTDDILSCFVLLTCLQHLKSWIAGTFQDAMKDWFMVEDDDGGDDDERRWDGLAVTWVGLSPGAFSVSVCSVIA